MIILQFQTFASYYSNNQNPKNLHRKCVNWDSEIAKITNELFTYNFSVRKMFLFRPIISISQCQSQTLDDVILRWCIISYADAAGPSDQGKWDWIVVIRDADGLVAAASCWYLPILPDSNVVEDGYVERFGVR